MEFEEDEGGQGLESVGLVFRKTRRGLEGRGRQKGEEAPAEPEAQACSLWGIVFGDRFCVFALILSNGFR